MESKVKNISTLRCPQEKKGYGEHCSKSRPSLLFDYEFSLHSPVLVGATASVSAIYLVLTSR